ncbi:hypothetical protein [uncultured Shewanella sp.]|uniref:hypothetical protein n=1 Tax=uncultured Shewanella sp. TaxID=173975 RepID=UPI00261BE31D|nr:hypothetical protein [uncultured Shewanella sp.]
MHNKSCRILLLSIILLPLYTLAMPIPITSIQHPDFLKGGFNLTDYQQCQPQLAQCPSYQNSHHASCLTNTIKQFPSCQQTGQLADFLGVFASQLTLSKFGQFTKVRIYFPGDGGNAYYLISPTGQLLNTLNPDKLKQNDFPSQLQNYFPNKSN